ncbi:MAG: Lactate-responsive regulator LldR in Enterobacteria, GntR family [uncultured Thiotrichaceae bacterium]|uniref:Lactate-responsive regulator LldR in Enterobacteria, GntR family n=1 Tax=uncultured Thiotrichaceae bacterium TaxID=298394 RepID=A0A6S6T0I0_9GAMM|nr:MAG: Lactate-responsive regulator LldR in Enterobacteria, GntR family [uncultured Thiotrichaceae bacterium]
MQAGDRFPAERKLAEQLEVSRPSLREAIQMLSSKGMLCSKPGGGTFVKNTTAMDLSNPMLALFRENPEYRFDVLEIRHALEGNAAFYAALRATEEDKARIKKCFDTMISLHGSEDPMDEARADAAFHLSIVEASHNLVLLHIMQGLFALVQNSISHNLDKLYTIHRVFDPLSDQHETLMQAILDGEPEKARLAVQEHLTFVEESLKKIDEEEARKVRSMRRLTSFGR